MILSSLQDGKVVKTVVDNVKFDHVCDVLVVGAGSAGVYSASSASRLGAKVILLEFSENLGGMHVCGNVVYYYYGNTGGSFELDDQKSRQDTVFMSNLDQWEQRQIRLVERLSLGGVQILCRHTTTGLFFDGDRVVGVKVSDGDGYVNIKASITIDATSDGHLIRMTDVKKEFGKANDGKYVPFTVRAQYSKGSKIHFTNADSGIMDHYNAKDFSTKTILAHANVSSILDKGDFINLASTVGVREGLTFLGEDRLSYKDILLNNVPDKVLFWAYSDLDRHGYERATEEELFQNWWVVSNLATVTITIPVPMGSVVPKGIKGLVTAGRCLSCDTYTQSAVRMNRDMFRMGECVGIASALASRNNVDFLDVDYNEFLSYAKKYNCFDGGKQKGFYFDNSYSNYLRKMSELGRAPDEKYSGLLPNDYIVEKLNFDLVPSLNLLKTDTPGVAFWSCYLNKDNKALGDKLYQLLSCANDDLYRYNLAIALGIIGDRRAISTLRQIVQNRDCFFFVDNRRSNQFRSVIAICLLGRLGCIDDLPLLFSILDDKEFDKDMYHSLPAKYLYHPFPDRNFVYFAIITHTCMAIYNIYKRYNLPLSDLNKKFIDFFDGQNFLGKVTDAKKGEFAYQETAEFIDYVLDLTKQN